MDSYWTRIHNGHGDGSRKKVGKMFKIWRSQIVSITHPFIIPEPLGSTLRQRFEVTQNHAKSRVVFGSIWGRRLSIWQNSTGFLHHFSARIFLSLIFRPQIGRFWSKLTKTASPQKGLQFLRIFRYRARPGPQNYWYRTLLDPLWTLFGSLMDLFWLIFVFLDYRWITAGCSLLLPYCCPIVRMHGFWHSSMLIKGMT